MKGPTAFIPEDRLSALLRGEPLPDKMNGSVLFADVTDYTKLVQGAELRLGSKRGAEEMTHQINRLFAELIVTVHQYQGIIIGFGGDALTCWFAEDNGLRAIGCGLAMQLIMPGYARIHIDGLEPLTLKIKVTIATGKTRRFVVGRPDIQQFDLLVGEAMTKLAAVQPCAQPDAVVMEVELAMRMGERLLWEQRQKPESKKPYALAKALRPGTEPPIVTLNRDEQISEMPDDLLRPWLLPEVYAWLTNNSGAFLAEIRPVTVLFIRFEGLNYSTDDAAGQKLNEYLCTVQQTLDEYEGFLLKVTIDDKGSYAMGAFGAPLAHEEQTHQALAAALELRTATASFPFVTQIQIGLTQGSLLAGAFGSATRATYDLLGPAANLAARVMMKAKPGQIIVTESIEEASHARHKFIYLGTEIFKGFEHLDPPTKIFELVQQVRPTAKTFAVHLVGRKDELTQLRYWQQQVLRGQGQALRIEGVAGIGKSHLRSKFTEQCEQAGFTIVEGVCDSTHAMTTYYPWQPVVLSLLGFTDLGAAKLTLSKAGLFEEIRSRVVAINPEWDVRLPIICEALQIPFQENATTIGYLPHQRQEALFSVVIDLVRNCVKYSPLLITIEDAHWIDEASLLLALALDRVIDNLPVLMLLVHRPFEADHYRQLRFAELEGMNRATVLHLTELSAIALRTLARNRLQGNPSRLLLSLLRVLAQGNPFYTGELLNALSDQQALVHNPVTKQWNLSNQLIDKLQQAHCLRIEPESGEWLVAFDAPLTSLDWEVPATLDAVLRARIDRLAVPYKLTLKTASVIGRIFETDILRVAQIDQTKADKLQEYLHLLAQRRFILRQGATQESVYAFTHLILQEVTYASLLEQQKSSMHWAVAKALEKLRTEEVERLVFHYSRTLDQRKTLFYLDKAASKAQRAHANYTAFTYYQQAIQLGKSWKRLKGMIEVLHVLGRHEEERVWLEELSRMYGVPEFDLAYLHGEYYLAVNEYTQAETAIQQAWSAAQLQNELIWEVRCLNKLGWLAWKNGGRYAQAEAYYQQALADLDGWAHYEALEAEALIDTLNSLSTLYRQHGQFASAQKTYKQALVLSQEYQNRRLEARTLENLGSLSDEQGHFEQGLIYHRAALRLHRMIGNRTGEGDVFHNLAAAFREQGEYKQFLENIAFVQEVRHATGDRWEEVNILLEQGIFYTEVGVLEEAEKYLVQGIELAERINDLEGRAYLLSNLGLVLRDQGKSAAAIAALNDGLAFMQQANNPNQIAFFLSYRATVHLQTGNLGQAMRDATEAITIRQSLDLAARTANDWATLALIYMNKTDIAQAMSTAEQIWQILEMKRYQGMEFPQRAYFVCYLVFQNGEAQARAGAALQSAYRLVVERAEKIVDLDLRNAFLTQVEINRQILAAYEHYRATSGK